jgi:hypothetical protein
MGSSRGTHQIKLPRDMSKRDLTPAVLKTVLFQHDFHTIQIFGRDKFEPQLITNNGLIFEGTVCQPGLININEIHASPGLKPCFSST